MRFLPCSDYYIPSVGLALSKYIDLSSHLPDEVGPDICTSSSVQANLFGIDMLATICSILVSSLIYEGLVYHQ